MFIIHARHDESGNHLKGKGLDPVLVGCEEWFDVDEVLGIDLVLSRWYNGPWFGKEVELC